MKSTLRKVTYSILGLILLFILSGDPGPGLILPEVPADAEARTPVEVPLPTAHWQGEMAGEVTADSVILQARLTQDGEIRWNDVAGRVGVGAFALSTDEDFQDAFRTPFVVAAPEGDHMVKTMVTDLEPGTRYYYRLLSGPTVEWVEAGPTGTFRTLDPNSASDEVSLVVVTGMSRFAFLASSLVDPNLDPEVGFPGLEAITALEPDFFVGTGDNVYYDNPSFIGRADTREEMRGKWHRQFAAQRFAELFTRVPTYWMKDDHDFRYNDADPYGDVTPSTELAIEVFNEQVPVVDPETEEPVTYRTHRINDLLQIWLVEGRDYRDPNILPPGPDKTMWGEEQRQWLQETLLESDAPFKLLISPLPMVGPDDSFVKVQGGICAPFFGGGVPGQEGDTRKRDNQTNPYGFQDERDAFFDWLGENGLIDDNFYIACGDRHWQYHSIHPSGVEEFSVGALVDANSRVGRLPGDDMSTDPDGLIDQPYMLEEASGGFLEIVVQPPSGDAPAVIHFNFYDEYGTLLYDVEYAAD